MNGAGVKVGAIYQAVDFGSLEFLRDGRTVHCTYTPGSVVKVVGRGHISNHVATELLVGAVTDNGRHFVVHEQGLYGHWVHAEELEPLDPANPPVCDSVTKEPAHDP